MQPSTIADVIEGRASWAYECRDGFALARDLPSGSVSHVIGDPPYDEQTHAGMRTMKDRGEATSIDFAALPDLADVTPSLLACSSRWILLFCTGAMLGDYKRAAGGPRDGGGAWIRDGYWHRTNGAPQISGDRPAAGVEAIAIMHKQGGRMRWARGGAQAFWEGPICKDPRRMHPTKKPLWLMEALVRDFTDPGDLVFDPTGGEGTTGEACVRLGRRFVGCEIDPRYHAAGVARIERAAKGLKQIDLLVV